MLACSTFVLEKTRYDLISIWTSGNFSLVCIEQYELS